MFLLCPDRLYTPNVRTSHPRTNLYIITGYLAHYLHCNDVSHHVSECCQTASGRSKRLLPGTLPSSFVYSNMPTCTSIPQTYATAQLLASHGNVLESEFYLGRKLEVLDKVTRVHDGHTDHLVEINGVSEYRRGTHCLDADNAHKM